MSEHSNYVRLVVPYRSLTDEDKRGPSPSHFDIYYGFSVRIVIALLALIFGYLFAAAWGAINGWKATSPLLVSLGVIISTTILIGEHVRSRVFERVLIRNDQAPRAEEGYGSLPQNPYIEHDDRVIEKSGLGIAGNRLTKRTFDLLIATLSLAVLSAPLAVIACIIRLDSSGPAFFRVRYRSSKSGRTFKGYHFRTTYIFHETASEKEQSPPSLTRVGRYLRASNLDRLPLLVNVIKGDVSLIGPPMVRVGGRIERSATLLEAAEKLYSLRMKPGISAPLWGRENPIYARFDYEYWKNYYTHWSFYTEICVIGQILISELKFASRL